MAREFAKSFYNSMAWRKVSKAYAASVFYLCEQCGRPGYIVHHKTHLTPQNIHDPEITLNWNNLMFLCTECHNKIHGAQEGRKIEFDEYGNLVGVGDDETTKGTPRA